MTGPQQDGGQRRGRRRRRLTDAELDARLTEANAELLGWVEANAAKPPFPPGPRYPEIRVALHPGSAVISAGWAAQALHGYGVPHDQVRAFMAEVSADSYVRAGQVIAGWVTVDGPLPWPALEPPS